MWHLIWGAADAADAAKPRPSADSSANGNALLCMMTLLGNERACIQARHFE
jgi:hypothetical protein